MISRIIEAKPEELRVFLEEAAGVSKYKERRRETENRLTTRARTWRASSDILRELNAHLEKLEAQAEVAARYHELQAELQLKQHLLWFLRRRDAAAERERHARSSSRAGNELEAENAELRSHRARLETARAAHYEAGDALHAAQGALYEANAEVARLESELRHAEETPPAPGEPAHRAARPARRRGASSARSSRRRCTCGRRARARAKQRVADTQAGARDRECAPAARPSRRSAARRSS